MRKEHARKTEWDTDIESRKLQGCHKGEMSDRPGSPRGCIYSFWFQYDKACHSPGAFFEAPVLWWLQKYEGYGDCRTGKGQNPKGNRITLKNIVFRQKKRPDREIWSFWGEYK